MAAIVTQMVGPACRTSPPVHADPARLELLGQNGSQGLGPIDERDQRWAGADPRRSGSLIAKNERPSDFPARLYAAFVTS